MTITRLTRLLFVRAVNVGGAKLPMKDFRDLLTGLGGENVRTYIASGNAIVEITGDADAFDRAVEQEMQRRFGWFREVMSRTPGEVQRALDDYPFAIVEPKFAYVVFLAHAPTAVALEAARQIDTGDDCWSIRGRELHLQYAGGVSQASPGVEKVLRRLAVPATARNLNTVRTMLELAAQPVS